ncbi:hypothetical protein PAMC26510_28915 [Caballeronia sordidicola]|uniref:Uncharacterized protein n=1 Tax=Caballeronia sordidicola TaxID=196367 RepID=A0A242MCK2_CABSO|nr:hypothetical protein PAMC26510_28915 [Caballeronia sordidicola]
MNFQSSNGIPYTINCISSEENSSIFMSILQIIHRFPEKKLLL